MGIKLGIDLGSNKTTIFRLNKGLVLYEPSKILCHKNQDGDFVVDEAGQKAVKIIDSDQFVVSPIMEGTIKDCACAAKMLKLFVKRTIADKSDAEVNAYFSVPCGTTEEEKTNYINAGYDAGIGKVELIPTPIADLLGCGVYFDEFEYCLLCDIGSGCTDIAILSSNGMVEGLTVNIGALNIDLSIISQIQSKYGLKIRQTDAQNLKEQIGSLIPNGSKNLYVSGIDTKSGEHKSINVSGMDILDAIGEYYRLIVDTIQSILSTQTEDIISKIRSQGAIFCGNGSKINGLAEYMTSNINMNIYVANGERTAIGLGKAWERRKDLKARRILM